MKQCKKVHRKAAALPRIRLVAIISLLLPGTIVHAQNMVSIEQGLLAKLKKIEYWLEFRPGDSSKIDRDDSLEKANTRFKLALLAMAEKYPASLGFDFPLLQKQGVTIATSSDRRFRIYSWDTWEGGTMHFFLNVYQWRGERQMHAKSVNSDSLEEHDPGPFCWPVYTFMTPEKTYYLVVNNWILSTKDVEESITANFIEGDSLHPYARVFKTSTGLHRHIVVDYDFFSVVDRPERPLALIRFDSTSQTIHIPLVNDDEQVTDRTIDYAWTGKYFERKK
jgi:hypothetical protein